MYGNILCVCVSVLVVGTADGSTFQVRASSTPRVHEVKTNATFFYDILPRWPPCCNQTVTLEFRGPDNKLLCQPRWDYAAFVDSTASCSTMDSRMFDFRHGFVNDGVIFTLSNVTLRDQGDFTLTLAYEGETVSAALQLTVEAPPPVPTIQAIPDCAHQECAEGTAVTLRCSVRDANPPATLRWERISSVVAPEEYVVATHWDEESYMQIRIDPLKSIDHGTPYKCTASNKLGHKENGFSPMVIFAPSISVMPCGLGTNYTVRQDTDARFHCHVNANPEHEAITWSLPSGVQGQLSLNATQLTVLDVDKSHSGTYSCSTTNTQGTGDGECILDVQYGAKVIPYTSVTVVEGERLELDCQYDANPPPFEVYWRKNDTYRKDGARLTIAAARPEDNGNYTCHVTNTVSPMGETPRTYHASGKTLVIVEHKAHWQLYAMTSFTGRIGSSATLNCNYTAVPSAQATWRRGGSVIQNGGGVNIVTSQHGSNLTLDSVTSSQLGDYICVVDNRHGRVEFELLLLAPGIPDRPQHCAATIVQARQVEITCVLGYNGGSAVSLFVQVGRQSFSEAAQLEDVSASLTIYNLEPNTSYALDVFAANQHGSSKTGLQVIVLTPDGPPLAAPPEKPQADVTPLVAGIVCAVVLLVLLLSLVFAIRAWGIPPIPQKYKEQRENNKLEAEWKREQCRLSRTVNEDDLAKVNKGFEGDTPRSVANEYVLHPGTTYRFTGHSNIEESSADEAEPHWTDRVPSAVPTHSSGLPSIDTPRDDIVPYEDEPREISPRAVRFAELIGEGYFSEVWRALLLDRDGRRRAVAVKMLRANCPEQEVGTLLQELDLMRMLKPHPNIIELIGWCTRDDPMFIAMEFASNGNLQNYLRAIRYRRPRSGSWVMTNRDLVVFALQVANGMAYVSSQGMLHRDLAARNILLDDKLSCKICDFGIARDVALSRQYESTTQRRLPMRWMALESLFDNIYTVKSDVWAFGVLLWEIATLGSSPYPGMSGSVVMDFLSSGRRMDIPNHCAPALYRLMLSCWHGNPEQRPSFPVLRQKLEAILDILDQEPARIRPVTDMMDSVYEFLEDVPGEKC